MMNCCGEGFLVCCADCAETQCKRASFLREDAAHKAWKAYW